MNSCTGRAIIISLFFLIFSSNGYSQTIENIRTEPSGDKVLIHFDLKHDNPSEKFLIRAYSSVNNFSDHLVMVKGDVGDRIAPGNDKLIEWYARSELGSFKGEVIVELRIFESELSYYILNPYSQSSFKRASDLQINWSGGLPSDKLEIDLYRDGIRLRSIGTAIDNTGDYKYTLPESLKPGSKYQIKLQSSDDPNLGAFSGNFAIKRKLPLGAKIIPAVAVIAAAYFILQPTETKEDLPGAPEPN